MNAAPRTEAVNQAANQAIFRKVALDRLASPEQLDQLMPVTDGRGWIALGSAAVVLLAVALWSITGNLPRNVRGTGVLVTSGGVYEVMPVASGRISEVGVKVGQQVKAGQLVARMEQPELSERLHQAQVALDALEKQHRDLVAFNTEGEALQNTQLARQRAAVRLVIASARKTLAWEARKLQQQRQLVEDGLLLRQTLLDTMQRHNAARERLSDAESQLAQLEVRDLEQRNQLQTGRFASEVKITEARRLVDELTRELKSKTEITSRYTGRILEVLTEQGRMVAAGEALLRLDETGQGVKKLDAIIYVPSGYGKQIKVGMPILISPTAVKQEEFGQIVARVTYVSDFPATPRGMQRTLKNEQLVQSLARGDAPFEVHAELLLDPSTPSGFRWSSSKGPPARIEGGSMATASVQVDHRRPIELVVPLIREWSGI